MYSASNRFHFSVDTSSRQGGSNMNVSVLETSLTCKQYDREWLCMCVCCNHTLLREYGINPSSTQSSCLCGRLCPVEMGTGGHVSLHHNQITATAHLCMDGRYYVGVWMRAHWQTRVSQKQQSRTNFLVYTLTYCQLV